MVALLEPCSCCHVTVIVLCIFFAVPWVGMCSVIVAFPGHAHLYFCLFIVFLLLCVDFRVFYSYIEIEDLT